MSCAVSIKRVSVSYRDHIALRDVSLEIHNGEFLGIIGPNGAGKTTLLTVINGLGRIHTGSIHIFGQPVLPAKFWRLRPRIGYVPQQLNVDPRAPISCYESVLIGRYGRIGLLSRPSKYDRQQTEEMLRLTGTFHLRNRPAGQVSGGEARKLAIARALVQEPEILLLDEPTSNLDPAAARDITSLIVEAYRRFHLTVVMVSHQPEHLPEPCNRIAMMKNTRIAFVGPREQALRAERLSLLYKTTGAEQSACGFEQTPATPQRTSAQLPPGEPWQK
ncbi:MAG: metal ABC transporter ATP-binding protein [candidate division WOR-3 bacterium]